MKTTGYALREALKQQELLRETASRSFNDTLKAFAGEIKDSPVSVMDAMIRAEAAIASLQTAQMRYNLMVTVKVEDTTFSLAAAVKLVGGVARAAKMWQSVAAPKEDRYGYRNTDERDPNQLRAEPTINTQEALKLATIMAKRAAALRQVIAVANATEVEIEDLDPSLFL